MITRFPTAPRAYSTGFVNLLVSQLSSYFNSVVSQDQASPRVILRSQGGNLYDVRVNDAGRLYTANVDGPPLVTEPGAMIGVYAAMTAGRPINQTQDIPTYDAPSVNVGSYFNPSTGRFTPPPGIYSVAAIVGTQANVAGSQLNVALFKNNTGVLRGIATVAQQLESVTASVQATFIIAAGDYIDARIWCDRTGQTVLAYSSAFSAHGQIT